MCLIYLNEITLSVCFGDDHVTRYMGEDVDAGEHADA